MTAKNPATLFHYASSETLVSIVQHRSLRLGGRWNLNDSDEGKVFARHLQTIADSELVPESDVRKVLDELSKFESYICCFSEKPDILSQWRGYANDGSGVSIGFNRDRLIDIVRGDPRCLLRPVTYADEPSGISSEIRSLMVSLLKSTGHPTPEFLQSAVKAMWEIKNSAFREEAEHRIILTIDGTEENKIELTSKVSVCKKFRGVPTGVREFWELPLPSGIITDIVLGPKCDSHEEVVRRLLRSEGHSAVKIRRSEATYR